MNKRKRILITGATGLVGSALKAAALKQNFDIHFLTTRKKALSLEPHVKGFYWNPASDRIDNRCFEGVAYIFHLAGASVSKPWTKQYKKEIVGSRLLGTKLLCATLKELSGKHQVKSIVCASAIGRYPSSFSKMYDEDFALEAPASFMEKVVHEWEAAMDCFSSLKLKLVKLRIGLVLSAKGGVLPSLMLPTRWGAGASFGTGKQGQSWIHIEDLVRLFLVTATEEWEGAFNAVAPNPVSQKELLRTLAKTLGRPFWLPHIPAFAARLLLGERSQLVLDSQWVAANKILHKGFQFSFPEITPALKNLLS